MIPTAKVGDIVKARQSDQIPLVSRIGVLVEIVDANHIIIETESDHRFRCDVLEMMV